jgi:hypothetical protein
VIINIIRTLKSVSIAGLISVLSLIFLGSLVEAHLNDPGWMDLYRNPMVRWGSLILIVAISLVIGSYISRPQPEVTNSAAQTDSALDCFIKSAIKWLGVLVVLAVILWLILIFPLQVIAIILLLILLFK